MESKKILTVSQMMITLFLCGTVTGFIFNYDGGLSGGFTQLLIAAPLQILMWFALAVPLWLLTRADPGGDILDMSRQAFGKFSVIISVLYSLFFLYVLIVTLSELESFVTEVVLPDMSPLLLSSVMMLLCLFASFYGLEGIARASVIVFAVLVAGTLLLALSSFPIYEWMNIPPLRTLDWRTASQSVGQDLSGSYELAALAIALPLMRGSKKKGFVVLNISTAAMGILLSLIIVLVLGNFSQTMPYPFFTVTQTARVASFERLDVFFSAIWMAAYFMKLSLYLFLFGHCLEKILPKKQEEAFPGRKDGRSAVRVAMAIAAVTVTICENGQLEEILTDQMFGIIAAGVVLVLFPVLVVLSNFIRNRRKHA